MQDFWSKIKLIIKTSNSYTHLIYINLIVFLILKILTVLDFLFLIETNSNLIYNYLAISSNIYSAIKKPWTFITYMFTHQDIFHLFFNLIWLHIGSKLFLQHFTEKQLISTYVLGGIFGALSYIVAFNIFPVFQVEPYTNSITIGASASILAIFMAISTFKPKYKINLIFLGNVPLINIAIILIFLDLILIPVSNAGGHIAHLGGAIYGYIFIKQIKKGKDISINVKNILERIINTFKTKKRSHKVYRRPKSDIEFNSEKAQKNKEIDKILEKIAKSGYESLNKEEKAMLFNASKK